MLFVIWVSVDGVPFAYFSSLDDGFLSYIRSSSDKIAFTVWVRWNIFVGFFEGFWLFQILFGVLTGKPGNSSAVGR